MLFFRYDHRLIDLFDLREAGIRTFREVEEMVEGYSFADAVPGPGKYYEFTGFTRESKAIKVTIRANDDADFVTIEVTRPTVDEIIDNFCQYC